MLPVWFQAVFFESNLPNIRFLKETILLIYFILLLNMMYQAVNPHKNEKKNSRLNEKKFIQIILILMRKIYFLHLFRAKLNTL